MFWILPTPLEPSIIVARTLIDRLLSTLAGAFNRETVSQGPFSPSSSIHPVHCFAKWQAAAACLHKSRIQLARKHDFSSFNLGRIIRLMTQINDSAEFSNPTLVKNG